MAAKHASQKLLDLVGKFVTEKSGAWDHADWESIVEQAEKIGMPVDWEGQRHLGNILEGAKYFYHHAAPAPAKAKAKPKTKSKAKAKAKAKPKTKVKAKPKAK